MHVDSDRDRVFSSRKLAIADAEKGPRPPGQYVYITVGDIIDVRGMPMRISDVDEKRVGLNHHSRQLRPLHQLCQAWVH